jgi:hypothetical protein
MIKQIQSFQITNVYGNTTAIREVDGELNLYEANFIFSQGVDICSLTDQELIDYLEGMNLNWTKVD